jgi:hypothetical protein
LSAIETSLILRGRVQRFDYLLHRVLRSQRLPRCVADHRVVAQLIDHVQQCALEVGPAGGRRTCSDAMNVLARQTGLSLGDASMLGPFVFGLAQPAHAQHHHLALARRQAGAVEDEATERAPTVVQIGMMSERLVDVEVGTTCEHRLLLGRAILFA